MGKRAFLLEAHEYLFICIDKYAEKTSSGEIFLDFTGKKSGRGAYVCKSVKCLRRAAKAKRIDKSLECTVPEEVYARMEKELSENE